MTVAIDNVLMDNVMMADFLQFIYSNLANLVIVLKVCF